MRERNRDREREREAGLLDILAIRLMWGLLPCPGVMVSLFRGLRTGLDSSLDSRGFFRAEIAIRHLNVQHFKKIHK